MSIIPSMTEILLKLNFKVSMRGLERDTNDKIHVMLCGHYKHVSELAALPQLYPFVLDPNKCTMR